jgi:hypothetical protein
VRQDSSYVRKILAFLRGWLASQALDKFWPPGGGLRAHDLLHGRHSTLYRSENIQGDPQMMSSRVPRNISAWLGPPPKDPNENEDENEEDEEDNDDENEEPAVIREPDDC